MDSPTAAALGVDIEALVTEDDTPVDNMPSEKQQRLLTEPLYSSWSGPGDGRIFLAAANVGVFPEPRNPAIVPDVFLSLDVQPHRNWWDKAHRSYFVWEFGKPPDLVVEIVSNQKGNEVGRKRRRYAAMGVEYYVINDPLHQVSEANLTRRVMDDELRVPIERRELRAAGIALVPGAAVESDAVGRGVRGGPPPVAALGGRARRVDPDGSGTAPPRRRGAPPRRARGADAGRGASARRTPGVAAAPIRHRPGTELKTTTRRLVDDVGDRR